MTEERVFTDPTDPEELTAEEKGAAPEDNGGCGAVDCDGLPHTESHQHPTEPEDSSPADEEGYPMDEESEGDPAAEDSDPADGDNDDESDGDNGGAPTDYESLAESDLRELKAEFPELRSLSHVSGLRDPMRYAALRDLGLSPREAYLATSRPTAADTRTHLTSAMPKRAASPAGGITKGEMETAKELFSDLSEAGIRRLYRRVTD